MWTNLNFCLKICLFTILNLHTKIWPNSKFENNNDNNNKIVTILNLTRNTNWIFEKYIYFYFIEFIFYGSLFPPLNKN